MQPQMKEKVPSKMILTDKKQRRRGGRWRRIIALFCLVLILTVGGAAYYLFSQLQPVAADGQATKKVTIPPGTSVREIGQLLEDSGLIRNGALFSYYAKSKGISNRLQAGNYNFQPGQTIDQLLDDMANGRTVIDTVRFTIPEGLNVEQIATRLAEQKLVDKAAFLKVIDQEAFPEYPFVAEIPQNNNRKHRLEGYLFPETYEVEKEASERDIVAKMLGQFQKEVKPEWLEALKARNLTLDQAVNLASIVEREVVVDEERPIVAGVFYNRIRDKWLLQSCATVQFILGKQRDRITFEDLEIDNPYNTYLKPGLPPGPIASPGRASLAAVVEPAKHDYFFFVTKKDGTSEHFFSKTFEEHMAKDAKSRGNW